MPGPGLFTLVRKGSTLFDQILQHARDCKPIMVQWTALLKSNARAEFDQNAPALAPATQYRYEHQGTGALTSRGDVRASHAHQLDSRLANKARKATGDEGYRIDEARRDLRRLMAGDLSKGGSGNKTIDRLRRRAAIAKKARAAGGVIATGRKKIEKHKRGGKMRNAFRGKIRGLRTSITNMVAYSGVHDKGGPVGNGATLPTWGFTTISAQVQAKLARIAVDWILGGVK